jgi:hypothetical protein
MKQLLKMLQLTLLQRVPFGKFNRKSAFPVVRFNGLQGALCGTWDGIKSNFPPY